jgi:polyisoprenoid-binding protein YceI
MQSGIVSVDEQLRAPPAFDVARFPSIAFRSTQLAPEAPGSYRVAGALNMRGSTRHVTFDLHGRAEATFSGTIVVNASEIGILCEPCWESIGGAPLTDRLDIGLEFVATSE